EVVPALAGAGGAGRAEVVERPPAVGDVRAGQVDEGRRTRGDVVAARQPSVLLTLVAFVHVHAGLAVGQPDHVERRSGRDDRGAQRCLDLRPGRTGVVRPPDPPGVRRRVHDVRVAGVELDVPDTTRRARLQVVELVQ